MRALKNYFIMLRAKRVLFMRGNLSDSPDLGMFPELSCL